MFLFIERFFMRYLSPAVMTALVLCLTLHPLYAMEGEHSKPIPHSRCAVENDETQEYIKRTNQYARTLEYVKYVQTLEDVIKIQQKVIQQQQELMNPVNACRAVTSDPASADFENPNLNLENFLTATPEIYPLITEHLGSPLYIEKQDIPFDPRYPQGLRLDIKKSEISFNPHNELWKLRLVSWGFKRMVDSFIDKVDLSAKEMVSPYIRNCLRKNSYARMDMWERDGYPSITTYELFSLQRNTLKKRLIALLADPNKPMLLAERSYRAPGNGSVFFERYLMVVSSPKYSFVGNGVWNETDLNKYLERTGLRELPAGQEYKILNPLITYCEECFVDFTHFKNLRDLNLSGNRFVEAADFHCLPNLTSLNIRNNNLEINDLCTLPKLTELHIDASCEDVEDVLNLPYLAKLCCYTEQGGNDTFDAMALLTSGMVSYIENHENLEKPSNFYTLKEAFEKRILIPRAYAWGVFYGRIPELVGAKTKGQMVRITAEQPETMKLFHRGSDKETTISLSAEDREYLLKTSEKADNRLLNEQRKELLETFIKLREISGKQFRFLGMASADRLFCKLPQGAKLYSEDLVSVEDELAAFEAYLKEQAEGV